MNSFSAKILALLALCVFALSSCYRTYYAAPITATVLDADTGKPIEGVVVVALWEFYGGLEGGNVKSNAMVLEAVTDANGVFHFPAWGPQRVSITPWSDPHLDNRTPWMIFFKSGYQIKRFANAWVSPNSRNEKTHLTSDLDGGSISMKRFDGTLKEYADHFYYGVISFPSYAFEGHCEWRKIPKMIMALREQTEIFNQAGIGSANFYTTLRDNDGFGCGSFEQFLEENGQ